MRKRLITQKGSALLITMIVITVLGTIAFAIGASTISALRRQSQIEDSQNAYQAAVSGLEDGLLRWRFDKNTETPLDRTGTLKPNEGGLLDCEPPTPLPDGEEYSRPTTSSQMYDRINLSTGEVKYCIDPNVEKSPDPSQIVYDIKIQYKKDLKEPEVVDFDTDSNGKIPALKKDDTIEYEVSEFVEEGSSTINLNWVFEDKIIDIVNSKQNFEVFALDDTGNLKSRRLYSPAFSLQAQKGFVFPFELKGGTKLRIKPLGDDVDQYTLKVPPAYQSKIALDSRITNLEVTGYFGLAKRKLRLTLDRASGSILPIYDYALFSQTTDIKLPTP